jgi:SAM-dependent methyltransferase
VLELRSTDRERLIRVYLASVRDFFTAPADRSVLHIAPEKRLARYFLAAGFADYVCGDLFTEGYRHPAYVRNMDVLDIPAADGAFDLVLCNHVLEHVPDDHRAMAELYRVLRPGGFAILQVPISADSPDTFEDFAVTDPQEREQVFGQFDHVRIYGQDYPDRLAAAGFTVERFAPDHRFEPYGVNPDEELFIGSK